MSRPSTRTRRSSEPARREGRASWGVSFEAGRERPRSLRREALATINAIRRRWREHPRAVPLSGCGTSARGEQPPRFGSVLRDGTVVGVQDYAEMAA